MNKTVSQKFEKKCLEVKLYLYLRILIWCLWRAAAYDCGTPRTLFPFCIPRLLCLCRVATLESLPVQSFNGVIISSARVFTFTITFRILLSPDTNLVSGNGCGLWLWHSLDFSLTFFCIPRLLCLCHVETLESFPVHSFNGVIISIARVYTFTITFRILLPPDTNLVSGKGGGLLYRPF